jgi:ribosome-associated protein
MANPLDEDLPVSHSLVIPAAELEWRFSASSGPGGQHVNTSNTRVEVRFDIARSPSLSEAQRNRLRARLGDEVRVVSQAERSQRRNRVVARQRLAERLDDALVVPRERRATRPTRASAVARLDAKARQSQRKQMRRRPTTED